MVYFLYFVLAVIGAFFIPGDLLVGKLKLKIGQRIVLAFVTGLVLWSLIGLVFGFLNLRFLFYPYLIIAFVLWIRTNRKSFGRQLGQIRAGRADLLLVILIVLGTAMQWASVAFMGIKYDGGMYFFHTIPDSLYHLALTNELTKNFPAYEPGMSGVLVKNYHILFNLMVADLVKVFGLPLIETQTHYLTLLLSLGVGATAWVLGELLEIGRGFVRWLVFFIYFAGDILYLFLLVLGKGLEFEVRVLHDSTKLWFSPPRVVALVVLLGALSFLVIWIRRKNNFGLWLGAICMTSLVGFKVYYGIFAIIGLGFLGMYLIYKKRLVDIWPLLIFLALTLAIYFPFNTGAGGLIWVGLWRFDDFIVRGEFGLGNVELARRVFLESKNYLRVIYHEVIYILLYFITVFGTLLLGFVQSKKTLSKIPIELNIILIPGIISAIILGSLFYQQTGGANSGQFLILAMTVMPIYSALAVDHWLKKINKKAAIIAAALIIALTGTRAVYETYSQVLDDFERDLGRMNGLSISNDELAALNFVKNGLEKDALILANNAEDRTDNQSYYLSFLGDRNLFLAGSDILNDHGVDVTERIDDREIILKSPYTTKVSKALIKNNIDYIYIEANRNLESTASAQFLDPVYQNKAIKILRIDKEKVVTVPQKEEIRDQEKVLDDYFKGLELKK